MTTHTSIFSSKIAMFDIIEDLKVELAIEENPYDIPLQELFLMAARINKKRSFLFVSKVLGKHIPIRPSTGILIGSLLAARYLEVVNGYETPQKEELLSQYKNQLPSMPPQSFIDERVQPIIIGFAETATALGHAFFEAFKDAHFFHTTRELLDGVSPTITFEEEHSHATSHRAYIEQELLDSDREIILVDDEVTTGKTAINIIRSIQEKFPRKTYTVVSILDWRSKENLQLFQEVEKELGITIYTVSLLKGVVTVKGHFDFAEKLEIAPSVCSDDKQTVSFYPISNPRPYQKENFTSYTGRFGLSSSENSEGAKWMEETGKKLMKLRKGKRTLVLGTGEFMYIPMKIASFMGENVSYHSSTRSPIYPSQKENYGVQNRFSFANPEAPEIKNYLYNIAEKQYDEIFIFFERKVDKAQLGDLLKALEKTKIEEIKIVYLEKKEGEQ